MASVHDVAAYILQQQAPMTAMKLQKLVYYSQAWSLVWDDEPLFDEPIEAWANGPVVRELYKHHRGQWTLHDWQQGSPAQLLPHQIASIEAVLKAYGHMAPHELSDLTHREDPWIQARGDLPAHVRANNVITCASMAEYYGSRVEEA